MAFIAENGTSSSPSFRFSSDSNLGFYRKTTDQMALSTGALWAPGISGQTSEVTNTYSISTTFSYPDSSWSFFIEAYARSNYFGNIGTTQALWYVSTYNVQSTTQYYRKELSRVDGNRNSLVFNMNSSTGAITLISDTYGFVGSLQLFWRITPVGDLSV